MQEDVKSVNKENFEGEMEANSSAFEALERDFQEVSKSILFLLYLL